MKLAMGSRQLLHRRFGHSSVVKMRKTFGIAGITGFPYGGPHDPNCETCVRMNANKAPFGKKNYQAATRPGQRIHSDIKVVPASSIGGHRYAICFVDCYSKHGTVYALKSLTGGEAVDCFRDYIERSEAMGITIECLRADNGSQYTCQEMSALCITRKGPKGEPRVIRQEFSPPHCQSANGVAECFWRDTFRLVRTILWDQQRGSEFWVAALQFAVWIRNRMSRTAETSAVPEQLFRGTTEISYAMARVPLTDCYIHVYKDIREGVKSLAPQRHPMIFVGYATDSSCYRVWDPASNTSTTLNRRYADVHFIGEPSKAPQNKPMEVEMCDVFEASLDLEIKVAEEERAKHTLGKHHRHVTRFTAELSPSVDGVTYVTLTKNRTVTEIARLFNVEPRAYLQLLFEHKDSSQHGLWFNAMNTENDVILKGSDVPLKVKPPSSKRLHLPSASEVQADEVQAPEDTEETCTQKQPKVKKRAACTPKSGLRLGSKRQAPRQQVPSNKKKVRLGSRSSKRQKGIAAQADYQSLAETYDELDLLWSEALQTMIPSDPLKNKCIAMAASLQKFLAPDTPNMGEKKTKKKTPKSEKQAEAIDLQEGNDDWEKSQEAEWNGLWTKGCFQDDLITGQKLHHLLWVYKIKSCGRKKSRLTMDGRNQDPNTYDDIRSPTMRLTSMRCLMSLSASNGWDVYADDATQGFINAVRPEDKPLWAAYPKKYRKPGRCLLIKRMLYGLHDAPRGWFECVRTHLTEDQGLIQSQHDECMFTNKDKTLVVVVHVDDFMCTGTPAEIKKYRDALHYRFTMTGGKATEYFGLNVNIDKARKRATLSAKTYITNMMTKLGIQANIKIKTPLCPETPLPRLEGVTTDKVLQKRYRSLVGSILHPANTCRPDVSAAARELSTHLLHPDKRHVDAAVRTVQYLYNTRSMELAYTGYSKSRLYGTCDASHNSEPEAKGVTGYTFHLNGGAVCWKSSTQKLVALSSCESELIAIDMCTRELRSVLGVISDMGIDTSVPAIVGQDNMATIQLVNEGRFNARTKHIDLRFHHAHQQVKMGTMEVKYLDTHNMSADVLTKQLPRHSFELHRAVLLGHKELKWPELSPSS